MNTRRSPFRFLLFVLFCLAVGLMLIVPISSVSWAFLAKQDLVEVPPDSQDTLLSSDMIPRVQQTPPRIISPLAAPAVRNVPSASVARRASDRMQRFVKKIRAAENDEDKEEAIEQAKAALEKHYDKYIEGFEKQVTEMESRVQKLRDQLDKRKDAKQRLVELKLEMLTNQAEGTGWPEENTRSLIGTRPHNGNTIWRPTVPSIGRSPRFPRPSGFAQNSQPPLAVTAPSGLGTTIYSRRDKLAPEFDAEIAKRGGKTLFGDVIGLGVGTGPHDYGNNVSFKGYFQTGIDLLEKGEYGEFLDRYLEPEEFRKTLKSSTLDEVSKKFKVTDAVSVLDLFKAAHEKLPLKRYGPATRHLTWDLELEDGSKEKLYLIRGEGEKWHILLHKRDQDGMSR